MRTLSLALVFLASFVVSAAHAQNRDSTAQLIDALALPEVIDIMRDEGLDYGRDLGTDMLQPGEQAAWGRALARIYDPARMNRLMAERLEQRLDGQDVAAMLAFFNTDLGRQIVSLEVAARRAMLDADVEEASNEALALAAHDGTARYRQITGFVDTNNLIDANVAGALNTNYAFYTGLLDGGALPEGMTAELALQEVWSQEGAIREETTLWLYSFLLMAYQPLDDAALDDFTAFTATPAGQALNTALFDGFAAVFDTLARDLGLGVAQLLTTEQL